MAKEGYKPTSGMQSAARRAIKLKEQGKAKGAGTVVGWTRAGQLSRGETLSLSTVKRMYSYFSRHEVDKKGKDWDNSENPSNGKIMWLAWGGDAGFSWSRKIVEREKNMKKSLEVQEVVEEIKEMLEDAINPVETVVEIQDDADIEKSLRPEITKEQLGMVVEHLMEAIEGMIEMPESEDEKEEDSSEGIETQNANPAPVGDPMKNDVNWPVAKSDSEVSPEDKDEVYKSDNEEEDAWDNEMQKCWTGYRQDGMKEKGGRMVPNCVPVNKMDNPEEKMDGQMILSEAERRMLQEVNKGLWGGSFSPDLLKRNFNTAERRRMAESGNAMPDGSYPIGNKNDLMNAIRSWGRGGSDPKVKSYIKRRAKELGAEDMIPENWK
jgi:hypothetical protein